MAVLSAELRAWLKSGLAGVIAVADDSGQPEIVRLWALDALDAGDVVVAYVQRSLATRLIEIVGRERRAALNVVEVSSYRSRLLKGACAPLGAAVDQPLIDESLAAQGRAFAAVGMPADAVARMLAYAPSPEMVGFRLKVDSVFDQSPKPGAGAPL